MRLKKTVPGRLSKNSLLSLRAVGEAIPSHKKRLINFAVLAKFLGIYPASCMVRDCRGPRQTFA
jgi:hypothetical protein